MEPDIQKLRRDLERFRLLRRHNEDSRVANVLNEFIGEAEWRLAALVARQRRLGPKAKGHSGASPRLPG
jgi:hypothetical protein